MHILKSLMEEREKDGSKEEATEKETNQQGFGKRVIGLLLFDLLYFSWARTTQRFVSSVHSKRFILEVSVARRKLEEGDGVEEKRF